MHFDFPLAFEQRQEAILEGAKKEGKVVIYDAMAEEPLMHLLKDFEQRYPDVKEEYFRADPEAVVMKALSEVRAGKWYWDNIAIGPAYADLKKLNALAKHYSLFPRGRFPRFSIGA